MLKEKVVVVVGGVDAELKTKDKEKSINFNKVMENHRSLVFLNVYFSVLLVAVRCRMCIVCD